MVGAVQTKIDAACAFDPTAPDSDAVVAEGQRIYARKPNMGEHDVTWSQAEYGHLGLQKEYIRYKSVQRLTEAWACLQRARRRHLRPSDRISRRPGVHPAALGVARRRTRL